MPAGRQLAENITEGEERAGPESGYRETSLLVEQRNNSVETFVIIQNSNATVNERNQAEAGAPVAWRLGPIC